VGFDGLKAVFSTKAIRGVLLIAGGMPAPRVAEMPAFFSEASGPAQ
jgi:hypothetical protein